MPDLRTVASEVRPSGVRARRVPLMAAAALSFGCCLIGCGSQPPVAEPPPSVPAASPTTEPAPPPGASSVQAEPAPAGLLAVGAPAPEVVGLDPKDQPVRLSERRGHPALVYFYPKNDTPGCTKEACAFRDAFDRFTQRGVTIFGVSRDDAQSHAQFRQKYSLPFPLVADPSGSVQKAYGVPDRMPGLASRVTFLVGVDGRIAKVWPDVDPGVHADEVLAAIEKL
jgi:thioredoxin-dependent peroxiredoxin